MKTIRVAVVCALMCVIAGAGCGKKEEATVPTKVDEQMASGEKTGNVVLDNIENEPIP